MAKETKLVDFGQKIGGARKDVWVKRGLCIEDTKNILGMRNIHMNMLDHSNGKKGILKQSMNGFRMK